MEINYHIDYQTDNKNEIDIIKQYWRIDRNPIGYRFGIGEIAETCGSSSSKISSIIKKNSTLYLSCERCRGLIGEYKSRSNLPISEHKQIDSFVCNTCKTEEYEKHKDNQIMKMRDALEKISLENLNIEYIHILNSLYESRNVKEIYANLFPGIDFNSPEGKSIWGKITELEKSGLIWIVRGKHLGTTSQRHEKKPIRHFFLPELATEFRRLHSNILCSDLKVVEFFIPKNIMESEPDAIYSGVIRFDESLKRGVDYKCSIRREDEFIMKLTLTPEGTFNDNIFGEEDSLESNSPDIMPSLVKPSRLSDDFEDVPF